MRPSSTSTGIHQNRISTTRSYCQCSANQYGRVVENREIQLSYQRGAFHANYYEIRLPIAPRTSIPVLSAILEETSVQLEEVNPYRQELESIITALEHLPPRTETDPERVKERRREKEIIKRRLSSLVTSSSDIRKSLKNVLRDLNGEKDKPESLDRLEELLGRAGIQIVLLARRIG